MAGEREAGWFSDARDPALARWHDGTDWTEHTMVKADWRGTGSPPPPAAVRPSGPALGRPQPSAPPAGRTGPDRRLLAALVVVLVLALGLGVRALIGGDDGDGTVGAPPSGERTYGADWVTPDGGRYRITITPSGDSSRRASDEGCVAAPEAGRTNLVFTVLIENLGSVKAPLPHVTFGANVGGSGAVDPAITTVDAASSALELAPLAPDSSCDDAQEIGLDGAAALDPGKGATFHGVIGGVQDPVPEGVALLAHYVQGVPGDTTGGQPMELLAPFPAGDGAG